MSKTFFYLTGIVILLFGGQLVFAKTQPNIILIFADDLGYADLSAYGANDISTPRLDELAGKGLKFTSFYSASPVCSPARAGLLTGKYPVRTGLTKVVFPESFAGLNPHEKTIAEVLKKSGYTTACIGKWHLGHRKKYLPLNQGFDFFYGMPFSNDMVNPALMLGNDPIDYQYKMEEITQKYTELTLNKIEQYALKENPFFIYLAHTMPHVPVAASAQFRGTSEYGPYGDAVEEMDWSTGQIMDKLNELGIEENTLIIFTSDNGPALHVKNGGKAYPFRNGKFSTFEGGMRVPAIFYWKNTIQPSVTNQIASTLDLLPTFAGLAGQEMIDTLDVDGENISSILFDSTTELSQRFFYYFREEIQAYRKGDWKLKFPFTGTWPHDPHPLLLFNLRNDPGETKNLAADHPEIVQKMKNDIKQFKENLGPLPAFERVHKMDFPHFPVQK